MFKSSRENIKKKDITNNISANTGIPIAFVDLIIKDLIKILIINLKEKSEIKITNFGSFVLRKKNKRTGRNPKNKKEYDILARNVVTFKTSKHLKEKINFNV